MNLPIHESLLGGERTKGSVASWGKDIIVVYANKLRYNRYNNDGILEYSAGTGYLVYKNQETNPNKRPRYKLYTTYYYTTKSDGTTSGYAGNNYDTFHKNTALQINSNGLIIRCFNGSQNPPNDLLAGKLNTSGSISGKTLNHPSGSNRINTLFRLNDDDKLFVKHQYYTGGGWNYYFTYYTYNGSSFDRTMQVGPNTEIHGGTEGLTATNVVFEVNKTHLVDNKGWLWKITDSSLNYITDLDSVKSGLSEKYQSYDSIALSDEYVVYQTGIFKFTDVSNSTIEFKGDLPFLDDLYYVGFKGNYLYMADTGEIKISHIDDDYLTVKLTITISDITSSYNIYNATHHAFLPITDDNILVMARSSSSNNDPMYIIPLEKRTGVTTISNEILDTNMIDSNTIYSKTGNFTLMDTEIAKIGRLEVESVPNTITFDEDITFSKEIKVKTIELSGVDIQDKFDDKQDQLDSFVDSTIRDLNVSKLNIKLDSSFNKTNIVGDFTVYDTNNDLLNPSSYKLTELRFTDASGVVQQSYNPHGGYGKYSVRYPTLCATGNYITYMKEDR